MFLIDIVIKKAEELKKESEQQMSLFKEEGEKDEKK